MDKELKALFDERKPKLVAGGDSNVVFYLHRNVTFTILAILLFILSIFYTSDMGQMQCFSAGTCKCVEKALTTFCWAQGTHSNVRLFDKEYEASVPHPGIGQIKTEDPLRYQWAYVWTYPYLFLALVAFRGPWWLWKRAWEGDRLKTLMQQINEIIIKNPAETEKSKQKLANYFLSSFRRGDHQRLAIRYVTCEFLNLVHIFFELWVTNKMLYGEFSTYGLDVVSFSLLGMDQDIRVDPMVQIFPRVTMCHMGLIGPGGNVQLIEGLCVLPLNTLFEKIFVLLWFWYLLLALSSIVGMLFRLMTICSRSFRQWLLYKKNWCPKSVVSDLCKWCSYGDWLVRCSMKNVLQCPSTFYEFLETLMNEIENLRHVEGKQ